METVNELLMDEAIRHQVDLAKYQNSVVRRMMAILNRTDRALFTALSEALERMDPARFTVGRLESMLGSVRAINAQAYAEVGVALRQELRDFVLYEVAYEYQALTSALPVQVHVAAVSAETVYAAALARPFQGALLSGFLADMEAKKAKLIRQTVTQGFLEGKTTPQIIREVRGTRAKGFGDGIIEITRRDAEAVVRTAMGHIAGFVQDRTTEANVDIIKAVQWSATLDLRTSEICRPRDKKLYDPVTHKPKGHDFPWLAGPGRAHWRCRSAQIYVLKSNKELGIDVPEIETRGGTRASMDGQIPKETTYAQWLEKQSRSRQIEVLGETRAALLRDGNLPLDRMYSQSGQYLTLDELRERDAAAFKRAGL